VRELAREYTQEAVRTLSVIMQDRKASASARVSAAAAILDRGWGKPEITATVDVRQQIAGLSDDDILSILTVLRTAAATGEPAGAGAAEAPTAH
jgi:hypothetical protein